MSVTITNAQIITPDNVIQNGYLTFTDEQITAIGNGKPPIIAGEIAGETILDAAGKTLLPGFIDVHVHGGANAEAMDASPAALATMARFYAQHGVTSFLATTWTDSQQRITSALEAIKAATGTFPDGATLLGAHLEGPYLNPEKCGAQSTTHIRRANRAEAQIWLDLDVIRLLALAPEYEENHWLISECVQRGIKVSAAHTAANPAAIQHAASLGLSQATHTFNAMTGLHHRNPGTVGAVLTMPEITCELISDNIHVHPIVQKLICLAKGVEGVILISDAMRSAGMPDGKYQIDERTVTVQDGVVRLPDGTLAGSTLTMDRAVFNFMQATNHPLEVIWKTCSYNAARALNIDTETGSITEGKFADLVLVDDILNVHLTIARGQIVYQKDN